MSPHAPRVDAAPGVWTPRIILAEAVMVSSTGKQDYLLYRNLAAADGLEAGELGCMCIGFRMKQLRGQPATCKHVQAFTAAAPDDYNWLAHVERLQDAEEARR